MFRAEFSLEIFPDMSAEIANLNDLPRAQRGSEDLHQIDCVVHLSLRRSLKLPSQVLAPVDSPETTAVAVAGGGVMDVDEAIIVTLVVATATSLFVFHLLDSGTVAAAGIAVLKLCDVAFVDGCVLKVHKHDSIKLRIVEHVSQLCVVVNQTGIVQFRVSPAGRIDESMACL